MIKYSVQIKRGIYYVQFRIPDKEGNLKQKCLSTGIKAVKGNKRKAEERAREIAFGYEGITADCDKMLLSDYVALWIEEVKKSGKSITTYDHYKATLVKHIKPYFDKRKLYLKKVKSTHIKQYCNDKIAEGLSPNTVIKHFAIIRAALNDAVKNEYIPKNPANHVEKPKRIKPTHNFYRADELKKAFSIVKGTDIELPVFFAMYFGLRRSEALGLRWSDINFDTKTITIRSTAVLSNGKIVFREDTKSDASQTDMPMNESVCNYLKAVKAKQENMPRVTKDYMDYVCVNDLGEIIKPDHVTHKFPKLMEQHGMKHICFHELRHSCISMVAATYNMKITQAVARHANYNITADTYSHIDNSQVAVALDTVTNILDADLLLG